MNMAINILSETITLDFVNMVYEAKYGLFTYHICPYPDYNLIELCVDVVYGVCNSAIISTRRNYLLKFF